MRVRRLKGIVRPAREGASRDRPRDILVESVAIAGSRRTYKCNVLRLNNRPWNILTASVRGGLLEAVSVIGHDESASAVLIVGSGRAFSVGADMEELARAPEKPDYRHVFRAIEQLDRLVVVAAHGAALGAGLEMMLACHYRCASKEAVFGMPEVSQGIIPGAGGTQRLPRIIGAQRALEFIGGARPVSATRAHALGLIDRVSEEDAYAVGIGLVRELLEENAPVRRTSSMRAVMIGFDMGFVQRIANRFEGTERARLIRLAGRAIMQCTASTFETGLDAEATLARATLERLKLPREPSVDRTAWPDAERG